MRKLNTSKNVCTVVVLWAAIAITAQAQTFTVLVKFQGENDGGVPYDGLTQGINGNLYGTTSGDYIPFIDYYGTVFAISQAGEFTNLYNFCSEPNCLDGASAQSGLVLSLDGNMYGTTSIRGANDEGTVFKITPGGMLTTLYNFCSQPECTDGSLPRAALVLATDGNYYGTTGEGGLYGNDGTVFKITPEGKLTTLHSFSGSDGEQPWGALVQATNGKFYGTTLQGGSTYGTVFSLDMGLVPFVAFVHGSGKVGQTGGILGQGFKGTTSVSLNGIPAQFKVVSDTFIKATVPPGATTGYVTVTTPSGTLTSNVPFRVIP